MSDPRQPSSGYETLPRKATRTSLAWLAGREWRRGRNPSCRGGPQPELMLRVARRAFTNPQPCFTNVQAIAHQLRPSAMTYVDYIDIDAEKLRTLLSQHTSSVAQKLAQVEKALLKIMRERDCLLEQAIDLLPDELSFFESNSILDDAVISSSGAILHHPMAIKRKGLGRT